MDDYGRIQHSQVPERQQVIETQQRLIEERQQSESLEEPTVCSRFHSCTVEFEGVQYHAKYHYLKGSPD